MMRGALLIVIIGLLCVVPLISQAHPSQRYGIDDDRWAEWSSWGESERQHYVWGVLTGVYALASDMSYYSGSEDILRVVENLLPKGMTVDRYIEAIEWIYEVPALRDLPVWVLILRIKESMDMRRRYER